MANKKHWKMLVKSCPFIFAYRFRPFRIIFNKESMKSKKTKLVPVSIRLEPQDKEKLETLCNESNSNKSEYLRNEVSIFLNNKL